MSKIGRKPIECGSVQVEVKDHMVNYKGPKGNGSYKLPEELKAVVEKGQLKLAVDTTADSARKQSTRQLNSVWGLHRALLANQIKGAASEFSKQVKIVGLGFKGTASAGKIVFNLGYTHPINFPLPKGVTVEIDKTGQLLTLKSSDKVLLGLVVSKIEELRRPEPYKGTGVMESTKIIVRKAGKTKAAAG
jgi:large subunit ribosomal protein L6